MKKILIIDDEQNFCYFMKKNLELTGKYEVHTASSGDDGITKALEIRPDVILLDIMMPDKNGFDVTMELKNKKETKFIPVVFISGVINKNASQNDGLGKGFYISKTNDVDKILAILDTAIDSAGENDSPYNKKEKVRIVTYLQREQVDFIDKLGKDVLFSKGFKLSRSETLNQLVKLLQSLNLNIEELDFTPSNFAHALLEKLKK